MITEGIRTALGEELAKQIEEALKGKGKDGKDLDLVVGNDGSYVPADKFNTATSGKSTAEAALKAAAEALKGIGGTGDPAKIADDVLAAQQKMTNLQETYDAEIARISKDAALRTALTGKVYDPADIIGLLDLAKVELDDSGNLKTNLDDMLKPIKESKAYLFKNEEQGQPIKGTSPAGPGQSTEKTTTENRGPVIL